MKIVKLINIHESVFAVAVLFVEVISPKDEAREKCKISGKFLTRAQLAYVFLNSAVTE